VHELHVPINKNLATILPALMNTYQDRLDYTIT